MQEGLPLGKGSIIGPIQRKVCKASRCAAHLVLPVSLAAVLFTSAASAATYSVTDLGTIGDFETSPKAINNRGEVVGALAGNGGYLTHAFLYSKGSIHDLGTLGGIEGVGQAINDKGDVVGVSTTNSFQNHQAFLYRGGTMQLLGIDPGIQSEATAINSSGQIVGYTSTPNWSTSIDRAFVYSDGTFQDLGTLEKGNPIYAYSYAYGINDSGQIVGTSSLGAYTNHAFLYGNGIMQDLGSLGGNSEAVAINASGQVIGDSFLPSSNLVHAFMYSNGLMIDLGVLEGAIVSEANAINASGQVVGTSKSASVAGVQKVRPFLYSNGTMVDLNSLISPSTGWTLQGATGINDVSQIVGWGIAPSGKVHGFMLTLVPEPSSMLLFGLGCAGIVGIRRLQRLAQATSRKR